MDIRLKESISNDVWKQGVAFRAGGAVSGPRGQGNNASAIDIMRLRSCQSAPQSQVSAVLGALLRSRACGLYIGSVF